MILFWLPPRRSAPIAGHPEPPRFFGAQRWIGAEVHLGDEFLFIAMKILRILQLCQGVLRKTGGNLS
jgi:hypothetical protein